MFLRVLIGILVCAAALSGQSRKRWVVSSQGGSGTVPEIQRAINLASPGDMIEVYGRGPYLGFTLGKAVLIRGSKVQVGASVVRGVTSTHAVELIGLSFDGNAGPSGAPGLEVSNCSAAVTVMDGTLLGQAGQLGGPPTKSSPGLRVIDSARVLVVDCKVLTSVSCSGGSPGIDLLGQNSALTLQQSSAAGDNARQAQDPCGRTPAHPAVRLTGGARLNVIASHLDAGDGTDEFVYSGACVPALPGGDSISGAGIAYVMSASRLRPGLGGQVWCGSTVPAPPGKAVQLSAGLCELTLDTHVLGLIGTARWVVSNPSLSIASPVIRGSQSWLSLTGPVGAPSVILFDTVHAAHRLPGIAGPISLSSSAVVLISTRLVTASHQVSFLVPNNLALSNRMFYAQGLVLDPSTGRTTVTNPSAIFVR